MEAVTRGGSTFMLIEWLSDFSTQLDRIHVGTFCFRGRVKSNL